MRELPQIAKTARRVLLALNEAVQRFPRKHKYQVGADLRREAMEVSRAVHRAWNDRSRQLQRVHELAIAIDNLKVTFLLSKDLNAFGGFREFEAIARLVSDLGRQCGGWLKQLHSKGQNDQAEFPLGQRAQILSSRDASHGAHP